MHLWQGTLNEFITEGLTGNLPGQMISRFYNHHGRQPSPSETRSWKNSLTALADSLDGTQQYDVGVLLEYHLPYSNNRIDVVLFGPVHN